MKLVTAMGGSMDEMIGGSKKGTSEMNALTALREVYEARIQDIKASLAEHINSLRRDKRYLSIALCIVGGFFILFLLVDLLIGTAGWIRY